MTSSRYKGTKNERLIAPLPREQDKYKLPTWHDTFRNYYKRIAYRNVEGEGINKLERE